MVDRPIPARAQAGQWASVLATLGIRPAQAAQPVQASLPTRRSYGHLDVLLTAIDQPEGRQESPTGSHSHSYGGTSSHSRVSEGATASAGAASERVLAAQPPHHLHLARQASPRVVEGLSHAAAPAPQEVPPAPAPRGAALLPLMQALQTPAASGRTGHALASLMQRVTARPISVQQMAQLLQGAAAGSTAPVSCAPAVHRPAAFHATHNLTHRASDPSPARQLMADSARSRSRSDLLGHLDAVLACMAQQSSAPAELPAHPGATAGHQALQAAPAFHRQLFNVQMTNPAMTVM